MIGKKIVCMRKHAEINCLPQRCIWKKLSAETTYVMQDLGNLKKNCLHSRSGGTKLASAQSTVEKISCLPEITIPSPPGKIMVRPLREMIMTTCENYSDKIWSSNMESDLWKWCLFKCFFGWLIFVTFWGWLQKLGLIEKREDQERGGGG